MIIPTIGPSKYRKNECVIIVIFGVGENVEDQVSNHGPAQRLVRNETRQQTTTCPLWKSKSCSSEKLIDVRIKKPTGFFAFFTFDIF
jgi:hypothetical protein